MKTIRSLSVKNRVFAPLCVGLLVAGNVAASEETLECTLYSADSMNGEVVSSVEIEGAGLTLDNLRVSAVCIFADGRVADKQYVLVNRVVGDGSAGANLGYSVYTMENGDSLSAQFTGEWGSDGYNGVYTILGGTGQFDNATGDGTITNVETDWTTTSINRIVLNVTTP